MPNASQLSPDNRFIALFVGPSGSGKTCAGCSFPGPIKVFDFDGRIRGILGAPWLTESTRSGIDYTYYPPRVGKQTTPTYQKINDECESMLVEVQQNNFRYKTILVGSMTSYTFSLLCDAIPFTHADNKGKKLGTISMAGPEDYGFEATNAYNFLAFLRSIPGVNIIVDAHIVDRYGKADPNDKYSERIVVGEKLSIRDKIGENIMIYFDHVFRFDKQGDINERFTVQYRGGLARTSYAKLPNGIRDVTGKNFYEDMMGQIKP
jgi:hypothetical protein